MSSHQLDFRGFLICFSFVISELFGALCFGYSVNFNRFGNFYNNFFFLNTKLSFGFYLYVPPTIFL